VCHKETELEDPKDLRARIRKFLILTNERKQMSKTTIRKRIALVAVSALTAGVISAVTATPANAGIQGSTNATASETTFNVAVGANTSGAVTLDTGVTGFRSLGLLDKDASSTTAQTATMLSSGSLVFYIGAAATATHTAITASGGTFGTSRATTGSNATYSDSLRTIFFGGSTTTVAASWTPGAVGTYTINAYRGTTTSTPTLTTPTTGTLVGTVTVTVVAAGAGGVYSAADSTCTVATVSIEPAALDDVTSTVTNGSWYINYDLQDAYGVDLPLGSIIATATGGGLVSLGAATATPSAGTDATQVALDTGGSNTVRVTQAVAGAPTTTTVKITYNGTTVCTKTVTIRGSVAKLKVDVLGTQDLGASTYTSALYNHDGAGGAGNGTSGDNGLFVVTALDSADNIVIPVASGFSEVASTMGATIQAITFGQVATSTSSTSVNRYTRAAATCGPVAGSASVQIKYTNPTTGVITTSPAFTLRCADEAYTYTASWDKASYVQGEIATLTVKFLDSKGNPSNRKEVTAAAAAADIHIVAPMMNAVTAVTGTTVRPDINGVKTYTFTVGTNTGLTAGSYNAVVDYSGLTAVAATKQTPGYKVTTGGDSTTNADVLKSIVALIASINKQIQALQKLILKR